MAPRKRKAEAEPEAEEKPVAKQERSVKRRRATLAPPEEYDIFVFGSNPFGALGLGEDETEKLRPALVEVAGTKFLQIACGGMHTVALSTTGEVWTWGVNDEGALGRPTSGTAWEGTSENAFSDSAFPAKVVMPEGVKFKQIGAGDGFTLALSEDGVVYGCGTYKDEVGSLARFSETVKIQKTLTKIWQPESSRDHVKTIACGGRHALALTQRGEVLSWGIGSQGQLGRIDPYDAASEVQPPLKDLFTPTAVRKVSALLGASPVVYIDCSPYGSFAVSKRGEVVAWGLNNSGQLSLDVDGSAPDNQKYLKWKPELADNLSGIVMIKGGEQHTLALTKKNELLSFGASTYGMLGRSDVQTDTANKSYPNPAPVVLAEGMAGHKVLCLAASQNVSGCVTADGSAWLWGSNVNNQLAKGDDDSDNIVPEKLRRTKAFGYRKIHYICLGGQHGALLAGAQEEAPAPAVNA